MEMMAEPWGRTEAGGGGHSDAEAAAEREDAEQHQVRGVLLPVLQHGEHHCTADQPQRVKT